jgi:kanamycin kinase
MPAIWESLRMLAGAPKRKVIPPDAVVRVAHERPVRAVWENEIGGLTFEIGAGDGRLFVKWIPTSETWRLDAEIERLRWAAPYTRVPEIVDAGDDAEGAWLLTRALPGENAVSQRWKADPASAVQAIGVGLRALHDALPVMTCPFS